MPDGSNWPARSRPRWYWGALLRIVLHIAQGLLWLAILIVAIGAARP